jgi:hypothetical protein
MNTEGIPELTNEELTEAYFSGQELELIAVAFRNLVLKAVKAAVNWVKRQKQRIAELICRLKGTPLLEY